jgi:integrase
VTTASSEVAAQADAGAGTGYRLADFEVPHATATLIAEAVPENTALAYRSRWRSFEAWCTRAGRVALPATAQTVAAYLTHLATERGLKATTVGAHLTAIRAVHRGAGATTPDALTARKVVVAAQRREAARDGRYGPRKAVPVMAADLPSIVAACEDQTAAGLRDRAVVLLGFALLARRSELAALNLSDVEHVSGEGIAVTIRASKTDQSARGLVRRIHYASNQRVCPVRAVLSWTSFLAARGIVTGPLFTRIDRWGNVGRDAGGRYADPLGSDETAGSPVSAGTSRDGRLRPQAVGAIVTALCESAGLAGRPAATSPRTDPAFAADATDANGVNRATDAAIPAAETRRYSGHSLRRGGATSMLAAGAQPLHVSRHGRWSDGSRSFAGYVEEATGFGDANPTKGLLLCMLCTRFTSLRTASSSRSFRHQLPAPFCATGTAVSSDASAPLLLHLSSSLSTPKLLNSSRSCRGEAAQ